MKRVSIIIVTHNSEDDIYDCVDSIIRYADIPRPEIELGPGLASLQKWKSWYSKFSSSCARGFLGGSWALALESTKLSSSLDFAA